MIPVIAASAATVLTKLFDGFVDKYFPDKTEIEKQEITLAMTRDAQGVSLALAQIAVNQVEASHPNTFVSGWRPFVGWVCGLSFAWQYLVQPILIFIVLLSGHTLPPIPVLDQVTMSTVLMGMLGLAGMRSFDKKNGAK